MSASPVPPLGNGAGESPTTRLNRGLSRSKSFYQAFLDAKTGGSQSADGQQRSLEVAFPELFKKALLSAYATRPPEDEDSVTASPSAGAAKGLFAGAAARFKSLVKPSGGSEAEGGEGSGAPEGVAEAGTAEEEEAEAPAEEMPRPEDGPDDPTATQLMDEFMSLQSDGAEGGGGGKRGGGLLGKLQGAFESGEPLDDSGGKDGGGGGASGGPADPQADLKKALKEKMEGGKEKMEEAMDQSFKRFFKLGGKGESEKESVEDGGVAAASGGRAAAGSGGGGFFAIVQQSAQKKLQEAKDAAAARVKEVSAAAQGGKGSDEEKLEPSPIEIKSKDRPTILGKDPWLPSGLSPRQVELRAKARELVVEHVLPHLAGWDSQRTLPRKLLRAAGREGFCGMVAPLLAGGRGWTYAEAVTVMEVLGAADLNSAALVAHQNQMAWMMAEYAGLLFKLPLTAALSAGLVVGSYASSEPWARKDVTRTMSFGVKYNDMSGSYWILNGFKDFTPLGGQADLYLVAVRTEPQATGVTLFVLPKYYPGMTWMGPTYDTVGVRSLTHRDMLLTCCIVRDEMQMAAGKAAECITESADRFRLFLAAAAVGAATSALELAHGWATDPAHRHFSHELMGYQALEHRYVSLAARVKSARLLVQHAAAAFDSTAETAASHAALAKRFAVKTALEVLEGVRTIFGAASVHVSYPHERVRRNLIAYQLLGGDMEDCVEKAWMGLVSMRKVKVKSKGKCARAAGANKMKKLMGLMVGGKRQKDIDEDQSDDDESDEEEE